MAQLCLIVFSIDGVDHLEVGYSDTPELCKLHAQMRVDARNANIEHEVTKLEQIFFGVSHDDVARMTQEVSDRNPNGTVATDLHPDMPARIRYQPVTPDPYADSLIE